MQLYYGCYHYMNYWTIIINGMHCTALRIFHCMLVYMYILTMIKFIIQLSGIHIFVH